MRCPESFQQQAEDINFGALATPVGFDWDEVCKAWKAVFYSHRGKHVGEVEFRTVYELDLGGSVSDTIKVDGGYRMYFHTNPGSAGYKRFTIWSAFSTDGRKWTVEDGPRLTPTSDGPDRLGVADPAVI